MQYPERHPLLRLYWTLGWVLIAFGIGWVTLGIVADRYAAPVPRGFPANPWELAWWSQFGWGYGLVLAAGGVLVLIYRALNKRSILLGDRIRREYK